MNEMAPVPHETRWLVWTDARAQAGGYGSHQAARWFWSASGPRGHSSGAENDAQEACNRAMYAAASLDTSMRPKG